MSLEGAVTRNRISAVIKCVQKETNGLGLKDLLDFIMLHSKVWLKSVWNYGSIM